MCTKGSRRAKSTPPKARRTGNPSPSSAAGAVVTETTWRSRAFSGGAMRGRGGGSSAVTAGLGRSRRAQIAGLDGPVPSLSRQELAVLAALIEAGGRVVPRAEIARRLRLRVPRRCDALLVGVRRAVGEDVVRNVRGRGWRLDFDALAAR